MRKCVILVFLATASFSVAQSGWSRYRVTARTEAEARRITDCSLGLFSDQVVIGETDVIVGPGQMGQLTRLGLKSRKIGDLPDPRDWASQQGIQAGDYRTEYLRYDDIIAQYESWRIMNPDIVSRQAIGTTWNGRTIWAYRLFDNLYGNREVRQSVVINCGIHAREWITPPVGMYFMEKLILGHWTRSLFTPRIPTGTAFYFIPVMNADGYEYTWTNDRFWRKNRRNNGSGSFGVDLNRNFSKGWGMSSGSSGNVNSETYRGPSAFSEPETNSFRLWLDTIPTVTAFLDLHSYGQLVLWPWGYTSTPAPGQAWLNSTGQQMKQAIFNAGGKTYTAGPTSTTLYLASGVSPDYVYNRFDAPSYTIELRDTGDDGFVLPASQIIPTQEEAWAGFQEMVARMLDR